MKKWIAVLVCAIILTTLFCYPLATAQETIHQLTSEHRSEPLSLSEKLSNILSTSDQKKIPVMIRFQDNYDEAKIEAQAIIEAQNTKTELSAARNKILAKHVNIAREDFMKSAGIATEDVDSYCSLIPLISLAWLSPVQIKQLTLHPDVLEIEYVDTEQKTETFAIAGAISIGDNMATDNVGGMTPEATA